MNTIKAPPVGVINLGDDPIRDNRLGDDPKEQLSVSCTGKRMNECAIEINETRVW